MLGKLIITTFYSVINYKFHFLPPTCNERANKMRVIAQIEFSGSNYFDSCCCGFVLKGLVQSSAGCPAAVVCPKPATQKRACPKAETIKETSHYTGRYQVFLHQVNNWTDWMTDWVESQWCLCLSTLDEWLPPPPPLPKHWNKYK